MNYIMTSMEREYGLKVVYNRKKQMTIYGPCLAVLELAVQTLIHKYILTTPPGNGILSLLRGKNAVWRFLGTYAKKVVHLFRKELDRIRRIRTVTVQMHPSRVSPNVVEALCSVREIEIVKSEVEKLVGLIHNLFVRELSVPDNAEQVRKVKELMQEHNFTDDVLCVVDNKSQTNGSKMVRVYGRNELVVWQVVSNLKDGKRRAIKDMDTPLDCVSSTSPLLTPSQIHTSQSNALVFVVLFK